MQSSTDRIVRQNRIEMHQSVSRVSSQSATPLIDQSQPCIRAIAGQSEAVRAGPDRYKNPCRQQFAITAISETEDDTSATRSSNDNSTPNYITTGSFQSHLTTSTDSTSTMTRTKQTARREREDRYPRAV